MATSYQVDLEFRSPNLKALNDAQRRIERLERAYQGVSSAQDQVGRKKPFQRIERGAKQARVQVTALGTAVTALGAGLATLGVGAAIGKIVGEFSKLEALETRLKTLTGSAGNAAKTLAELREVNVQSPFKLNELADAAARLSAFGVETDKLVETTSRLGKAAAATGSELGELSLAYGQVLAKGRLQGEELLQFQERGIPLAAALRKQLELSRDEFDKMLRAGLISSKEVQKAIEGMTDETGRFGDAFENTANTMEAKLSNLEDAFNQAAAELGRAFEPQFKYLTEELTKLINLTAQWARSLQVPQANFQQFAAQAEREAAERFGPFDQGRRAEYRQKRIQELIDNWNKMTQRNSAGGGSRPGNLAAAIARANAAPELPEAATGSAPGRASSVAGAAAASGRSAAGRAAIPVMIVGGRTGGALDQPYSTRGRSTGPHAHGQGDLDVLRRALVFPGGLTLDDFPITQGPHGRGGSALDWGTPQGTPFRLRPGFTGRDISAGGRGGQELLVTETATGRSAFISHLLEIHKGQRSASDPWDVANQAAENEQRRQEEERRRQQRLSDLGRENELATQISVIEDKIFTARQNDDEQTAVRLEAQKELLRIGKQIKDTEANVSDPEERKLLIEGLDTAASRVMVQTQQRLAEIARERAEAEADRRAEIDKVLATYQQEGEMLQAILDGKEEELKLQREINRLTGQGVAPDVAEAAVQRTQALRDQVAEMEKMQRLSESIGETIGQGIGGAIRGLVDGTRTLNDVLAETAGKLGDILISAALQKALGGASIGGFGGLPPIPIRGFASGGRASGLSLVGEKGPELVNFGSPANILANSETRQILSQSMATSRANAANGNSGGSFDPEAFGGIEVAVNWNGPSINVDGERTVRQEDVPELIKAATNQAVAQVFRMMRNNPQVARGPR